ncbi:hypothetical protein [Natronomonas amylolytica]|uniref:hypothetical protein n=1 Tax=Natronomonas amylolytica TaxID=3108498 RepID=UPI00300AB576
MGDAESDDGRDTRSLSDGWVGAVGIVIVTAAVLVATVLLTPESPDCTAYIGTAKLLCPWYRELFGNAALLFGVLLGIVVVVGYPIRLLHELLDARG